MIGRLKSIIVYDKQRKATSLSKVCLSPGKGIPGDRHYEDEGDPISLWFCPRQVTDLQAWPPPEHRKGLCTLKFRANLIALPLDETPTLNEGDSVLVGDVTLRINTKKPCYDQCPLVASGDTCALKDNVYFTSVAKSGTVEIGDRIQDI